MERREDRVCFGALLLASALLLLALCSASPLYPTNPWGDSNCFVTVARGMRAGLVPYRDLYEQKGPLLYALHFLAVLVSPNGFFGVYLLETLAMAVFLFASWKTVCLFVRERAAAALLLVGIAALMVCTRAFYYGDSAEELCAPLLAWSMYEALRYFKRGEPMGAPCLLRNGILAGCVLWIKYSLLGVHFAWMAVIALDCVIRERKIWNAARMCAIFLAGMALSAVPWLIYFGANGAVGDWLGFYFVRNLSDYGGGLSFWENLARNLWRATRDYPWNTLLLAAGVLFILRPRKRENPSLRICLCAMLVCCALMAYFSHRASYYMAYVFAPFVALGAAPAAALLGRVLKPGWPKRCAAVLMVCACVVSFRISGMTDKIGYPREELVQTKFARVISETEGATLLNLGFLDGGFYLAADVQPITPWFVVLNMAHDECFAEQKAIVEEGRVDYVVTRGIPLGSDDDVIDSSRYVCVMEAQDDYSMAGDQFVYYLYRRSDLNA